MRLTWVLFKREFLGFFRTPIAYIFMACFYLASITVTFFLGRLLDTNQADLAPFFKFLPWVMLVIVPGTGMRLWAEERASRTLELSLTLPVDLWQHIWAKFLAGWAVVCLGLFLTLPLTITVSYLGEPDFGSLLAGYLGACLMSGAFLSVSCACSAVTKKQVIGFILSFVANFFLLLLGWGVFGSVLGHVFPISVVDVISEFGVITHYEAMGRGVVNGQDVGYFVAIIVMGLCLSAHVLERKQDKKSLNLPIGISAAVALLVLVNLWNVRLDLTENRSYSLSDASIELARSLPKGVEATFYFSRSLPSMPPFIKQFGTRVYDMLELYALHSDGRLSVKQLDPRPDTEQEEEAARYGVKGVSVKDGLMYMGVSLIHGETEVSLPFLDPVKETLLEYEISHALSQILRPERPVLGVYSSLKIEAETPEGEAVRWGVFHEIEKRFDVRILANLKDGFPEDMKTLMILHPKGLKDEALYQVDQFVMNGGRLLVLLDPFSRIEMIQQYGRAMLSPGGAWPQLSSNLGKLLGAWHIDYDSMMVVGDHERGTSIGTGKGSNQVYYPLFPKLRPEDLGDSPITAKLRQVMVAEGGRVSLRQGAQDITFKPLLMTSAAGGHHPTISLPYQSAVKTSEKFVSEGKSISLGGIFSGRFKSAFQENPNPLSAMALDGQAHRSQALLPNEIIVLGDVDFIENRHAFRHKMVGEQRVRVPKNDNASLILNSLDYLEGSHQLMAIRSAGKISRPFVTLLGIQEASKRRWNQKAKEIDQEVKNLDSRLHGIYRQELRGNVLALKKQDLKTIKDLRRQKRWAEVAFHNIRSRLQKDLHRLKNKIISLNVLAGPTVVLLGAGLFFSLRRREPKIPLKLKFMALSSPIAVAAAAFFLVVGSEHPDPISLSAKSKTETIYDIEELSKIHQVKITSKGESLTMVKGGDHVWRLREKSLKAVNADRLSRMLYDFSEARIIRRLGVTLGQNMGFQEGRSILMSGPNGFRLAFLLGKRRDSGGTFVRQLPDQQTYLVDYSLPLKMHPNFWLAHPE